MKRFSVALVVVFFIFSGFCGELNLASFQTVLINPWWTHSGNGKYSKTVSEKDGEKLQCVKLTGGSVSLTIDSYRYPPFLYSPSGRFCVFSLMAEGKGSLEISIISRICDEAGKDSTQVLASRTVELSENWQKISIEGQSKNPRTSKQILSIKLLSGDYALMRDADFHYSGKEGVELQVVPKTALIAPGAPSEIKITLKKDASPIPNSPVKITVFERPGIHLPDSKNAFKGKAIEKELSTNSEGIVNYKFDTAASGYGARVNVFSPVYGVSAESFVLFSDKETIDGLNKAADAIKISKPISILIIGDSLSDFARGYNYPDIISSFLNMKSENSFKMENLGIGGDYITRVWDRVCGIPDKNFPAASAHRQYMYDGFLKEKPDFLFLFLGHNDTRTWSDTNFSAPEISPDEQYSAYCKFLDYVRENSPETKIILFSNTASYLPAQEERAAAKKDMKKRYCIYGFPQFMEAFNDTLKKIAAERHLAYIDLYTATKNVPDRKSLFLPDGIHLSPKGNQFVALTIIKNLAEKNILENR